MNTLIAKLKKMPQGVKASIAFFFANAVHSGISYLVTPVYTRLLTTEEFGQTSVYMTWLAVFGNIAMFCLSAGVFNNGMIDYPDKRDEYSFSMLILSNLITLCFAGVLLCLYPIVGTWLRIEKPLLILMCVTFLFQPAYSFWVSRQRYELKYKTTAAWSVAVSVLSPLTAVTCIFLFPQHRLYARIFGAEVSLIVVYILFYIYLAYKGRFHLETKYWKAVLLFNLPLIPHYLSGYLLNSSDKLMISYLVGDSATAYYSVAYSVAAVVGIVWSAVNSSLIPYTYEKCRQKKHNDIAKVTLPILTAFAGICVLMIMMAPEVVAIMATADYTEAIYAIPPIVGGVFFQMHYFIYANVVYYYKRPKYVMYASVISTLLNLILNYIFISRFGYLAAGYTTLICYLCQAAIDYFAMKKVVGESIYNMKFIGILSLVVTLIALFSNLLYGHMAIRYIVIGGILIVCVVLRKRIMSLITELRKKENEA